VGLFPLPLVALAFFLALPLMAVCRLPIRFHNALQTEYQLPGYNDSGPPFGVAEFRP
jgi:hypothetical protein